MAESASRSAKHRAGMTARRRVLGDAHVDRAERNKTAFEAPFQELITEAAWGTVWSRPHGVAADLRRHRGEAGRRNSKDRVGSVMDGLA